MINSGTVKILLEMYQAHMIKRLKNMCIYEIRCLLDSYLFLEIVEYLKSWLIPKVT